MKTVVLLSETLEHEYHNENHISTIFRLKNASQNVKSIVVTSSGARGILAGVVHVQAHHGRPNIAVGF